MVMVSRGLSEILTLTLPLIVQALPDTLSSMHGVNPLHSVSIAEGFYTLTDNGIFIY